MDWLGIHCRQVLSNKAWQEGIGIMNRVQSIVGKGRYMKLPVLARDAYPGEARAEARETAP